MIRQPVSRISFDRQRGFLGVHLQEGALFVDAAWNEGADISFALLRDAIVASGLEGTAGRELLIAPEPAEGPLVNLWVRGTNADPTVPPRPFYANGLPVLWPADRLIDNQGNQIFADLSADELRQLGPDSRPWLARLKPDVPYEIYLRARIATVDRLDDAFLDDPGLDAAHGSFRKRVLADVRVRPKRSACPRLPTNIQLSVDGSYQSDLNVLYRVELDRITSLPPFSAASVLWDTDAGATVARVVDTAAAGARLVMLDTTERFTDGYVRFEGKDIGPELYAVVQAPGLEGAAIQVTPHRCDRATVSLAARQLVGKLGTALDKPFEATVIVPPATSSGFVPPLEVGDLVTALPGGHASSAGPWIVQAATRSSGTDAPVDVVTLAPAGLAHELPVLDETRRATLRVAALPFDTTLTIDGPGTWKVGERIAIFQPHPDGPAVTAESVAAREDRVIVRIEPLLGPIPPTEPPAAPLSHRMIVRLDQPLAYAHAAGEVVIPERLIRVRRFAGHACRVPIEGIHVQRDRAASLEGFSAGTELPHGLAFHLTTECGAQPRLERGDGWHFAARGDGFVETRLYAPVEEELASDVVLAQLTLRAGGYELLDLRPMPAALAVDDELARIGAAAAMIAALLDGDPAKQLLTSVVAATDYARAQKELVPLLRQLAVAPQSRLRASIPCRPWLARLEAAVMAVTTDSEPNRRELAAIDFALTGLAYAFASNPSIQGRKL